MKSDIDSYLNHFHELKDSDKNIIYNYIKDEKKCFFGVNNSSKNLNTLNAIAIAYLIANKPDFNCMIIQRRLTEYKNSILFYLKRIYRIRPCYLSTDIITFYVDKSIKSLYCYVDFRNIINIRKIDYVYIQDCLHYTLINLIIKPIVENQESVIISVSSDYLDDKNKQMLHSVIECIEL
jgi:hypothetical protein